MKYKLIKPKKPNKIKAKQARYNWYKKHVNFDELLDSFMFYGTDRKADTVKDISHKRYLYYMGAIR